jgi:hypothetical protein
MKTVTRREASCVVADVYQESVLKDLVFGKIDRAFKHLDLDQRVIQVTTLCINTVPRQIEGYRLEEVNFDDIEITTQNVWTVDESNHSVQKENVTKELSKDLLEYWKEVAGEVKELVNQDATVFFMGTASFSVVSAHRYLQSLKSTRTYEVKFEIRGSAPSLGV